MSNSTKLSFVFVFILLFYFWIFLFFWNWSRACAGPMVMKLGWAPGIIGPNF